MHRHTEARWSEVSGILAVVAAVGFALGYGLHGNAGEGLVGSVLILVAFWWIASS